MNQNFNLKKELVLERFRTLNPESKISIGGHKELTVRELMEHIEREDEFGKNIIKVQMKMLQVLAQGV